MSRLPTPGGDTNVWGDVLNDFLSVEHNSDGTLKASGSLSSKADDSSVVHKAGAESIGGVKTFSSAPIVPTPSASTEVANKSYVDGVAGSGSTPDADATTKGKVQLAGDLSGTAAAPTVPGLSGKVDKSTATTKGDLLAATGSAAITRLGVGSDNQVLTADSSQTTGIKWSAVSGSSNPSHVFTLASGTSPGTATITVDHSAAPLAFNAILVIEPFNTNAEVRRINTVSGTTVTLRVALLNAHSSGTQVMLINGNTVSFLHYGAKGDGSTDDTAALQHAIDDFFTNASGGAWLDGSGATYIISQPLPILPSAQIQNIVIKAKSTYAPADANNAMLMNMQGNATAFTGTAATSSISAPSSTITTNGMTILFKGSSLPGGVTAGRRYWVVNFVTKSNFQISLTYNGSPITISSDGSGTAYSEIISTGRLFLVAVFVDGNLVAGINGVAMNVQQQHYCDKLRIQNCPGFALYVGGQQGHFLNTEAVKSGVGIRLVSAEFMYFYNTNAEQNDINIQFYPVASDVILPNTSGGNTATAFYGLHMEHDAGTTAHIDYQSGGMNVFDTVEASMGQSSTKFFDVTSTAGVVSTNSYTIRNVLMTGASLGTDSAGISDPAIDGGTPLMAWGDFHGHIHFYENSQHNSSQTYVDKTAWTRTGFNKRRFSIGGSEDGAAMLSLRAASSQTGDLVNLTNSSDAVLGGITKSGYFYTPRYYLGTDTTGPLILSGSGSPAGVISAPVGSLYLRNDGSTDTAVYRKETGSGTSGWIAMVAPGGGGSGIVTPGLRSGKYYDSHTTVGSGSATTQNRAYALPIWVGGTGTADRIGVEVTTLAASSTVRLGLYSDSTYFPGTLLLDAGTVDSSTTGIKELTISQSVSSGLYWAVAVAQGGVPSLRFYSGTGPVPFGMPSDSGYANARIGFIVDSISGALPSPWSGSDAGMIGAAPRVMIRIT